MTRALVAIVSIAACGCALTSRGDVLSVRYFDPETSSPRPGAASAQAETSKPVLRLGRVRGAPYLRERIAYRKSEYEVGFYDDREWTERPEEYVRRALVRKLFEERGFERATAGPAPSLQIDVIAFDELRMPHVHGARVEVRYQIRGSDAVIEERTIVADRPVRAGGFEDVVAAMSAALDDVTERIADRVAQVAPR